MDGTDKLSFALGDVVRLRSGGPEMTVSELSGSGGVCCLWFSDGVRCEDWFLAGALKTARRPGWTLEALMGVFVGCSSGFMLIVIISCVHDLLQAMWRP